MLCVGLDLCLCSTSLTELVFLTAIRSSILYRETVLSTSHHSKSHSVLISSYVLF